MKAKKVLRLSDMTELLDMLPDKTRRLYRGLLKLGYGSFEISTAAPTEKLRMQGSTLITVTSVGSREVRFYSLNQSYNIIYLETTNLIYKVYDENRDGAVMFTKDELRLLDSLGVTLHPRYDTQQSVEDWWNMK